MYNWICELDRILRGEATQPADIRRADNCVPVVGISFVVIVLAVAYGLCMGAVALVRGFEGDDLSDGYLQAFATMCKVPLLFALTLTGLGSILMQYKNPGGGSGFFIRVRAVGRAKTCARLSSHPVP